MKRYPLPVLFLVFVSALLSGCGTMRQVQVVERVQKDTIPVIREVEVVKTERYTPTIYKWALGICIALIILIVLSILKKFFL